MFSIYIIYRKDRPLYGSINTFEKNLKDLLNQVIILKLIRIHKIYIFLIINSSRMEGRNKDHYKIESVYYSVRIDCLYVYI